ncbi:MAG: hypothetical protein WD468_02100 [Pirellulales bacterium]
MLESLFELAAELVLQLVAEVLYELGLHSLAKPFRRPANPWFAAFGYLLFGVIAGGLSLLLFPSHLVAGKTWQIVNLIVTPIAVGLLMSAMGAWRARRGEEVLRIDRFSYGYLFALALALIRFYFAK